jgi:hypothetical protein
MLSRLFLTALRRPGSIKDYEPLVTKALCTKEKYPLWTTIKDKKLAN